MSTINQLSVIRYQISDKSGNLPRRSGRVQSEICNPTSVIWHLKSGFTLVELLVVLAIIGVLVALSSAAFQGSKQSARDATRRSNLEEIRSGLEIYRTDCAAYPAATYTTNWPAEIRGDGSSTSCATSNVYLRAPRDPLDPIRYYRYSSADGVTYELCASLENGSGSQSCGGSQVCGTTCNYKVENP